MRFIKRKRKFSIGEREESSVNVFRMVLLLAAGALLCFLVYALMSPRLFQHEEKVIVPYGSTPVSQVSGSLPPATPTSSPSLTPVLPTPLPSATPVPQGAITRDSAPFVEQVMTLPGHSNAISGVAFSPDGTYLASGSQDGTVRLWDAATGAQLDNFTSSSNRVNSVAFSADGRWLAAGGNDTRVRVWDIISGEWVDLQGPTGAVRGVAFSPRAALLAAGSDDGKVYLWDVTARQLVIALEGHTSYVTGVAFNRDGTVLAAGGDDDTIRLWKVPSGAALGVLQGHTSGVSGVAFSPDGATLASTSFDHTVRLWDVAARVQRSILSGHTENVNGVAFSPDGSLVVSAAGGIDDNTVRLWDAVTGAPLGVLMPGEPVNAVAFSPNGRQLVTGGATMLALWGVAATYVPPTPLPPPTQIITDEALAGETSAAPATSAGGAGGATCALVAKFDETNVRAGPGTEYEAADSLAQGDNVPADGWAYDAENYVWWRLADGQGWVRADTVDWPPECQALPPVEP